MPVPHSEYSAWASCGLGSTVTREDVKEIAPGLKLISSTSMTLAAVDKDKVVIDMVVRNRVEGGPIDFPPTEILQELEIPAQPGPPRESSFESYSEVNEDGSWGIAETSSIAYPDPDLEGDETLIVAGRSVPCRWNERRTQQGPHRTTLRTWVSELIPGGLARLRVRVEGDAAQEYTTEVVAFEKKPV